MGVTVVVRAGGGGRGVRQGDMERWNHKTLFNSAHILELARQVGSSTFLLMFYQDGGLEDP